MEDSKEIAVVEQQTTLARRMKVDDAIRLFQMRDEFIRKALQEKVDFMTIPGTSKPSLLKPGSEKLLVWHGYVSRQECISRIEDWEGGFFNYEYKCTIIDGITGIQISECCGSANSKESRYKDRWLTEKKVRAMGLNIQGLDSRDKTSQYGEYKEYRIDNPDPYTLVNTLQKMAQKRALVGATLLATATSEVFTQDMEDIALKGDTATNVNNSNSEPTKKTTKKASTKKANGKSKGGEYISEKQFGLLWARTKNLPYVDDGSVDASEALYEIYQDTFPEEPLPEEDNKPDFHHIKWKQMDALLAAIENNRAQQ